MRRVALVLLATSLLAVGALAGPAGASVDAKSKKTAKITECKKDKNAVENIRVAFTPFFLGATSAEKLAGIADGDKLVVIIDKSTAAANASGQGGTATTATFPVIKKVTCDGKTAATFEYDLALNQPKNLTTPPATGVGLAFAGDAELVKGKWKVSGATLCDLVGANPATPTLGAECLTALGS